MTTNMEKEEKKKGKMLLSEMSPVQADHVDECVVGVRC